MKLRLSHPWLVAELSEEHRVLSWCLNRPGFTAARRVVWREVRNADLPLGFDVTAWFGDEMASAGHGAAIGFLTSRGVASYTHATASVDGIGAAAVATVGLSNAERAGRWTPPVATGVGTINILVTVEARLSDGALVEALSIAASARTAAMLAHGPDLPQGRATGTGTDCIAVAARPGTEIHAGLHTPAGHAIGAAVLDAVGAGVRNWMHEHGTKGR